MTDALLSRLGSHEAVEGCGSQEKEKEKEKEKKKMDMDMDMEMETNEVGSGKWELDCLCSWK